MKNGQLKQAAMCLAICLSLVFSSLAVCACAHHQAKTETAAPSCHQESHEAQSETYYQDDGSTKKLQTLISESECRCVSPAPQIYAKSEHLKIEKRSAANAPLAPIETIFVAQTATIESDISAPLRQTDSHYNIKSPRAPPRL